MTIEVRQLVIKSQVNPVTHADAPPAALQGLASARRQEQERTRLKEEILAECKAWLAGRLHEARER